MFGHHNHHGFPFGKGFGQGGEFGRERFGRGKLNIVILDILSQEPRHGYDVIKAIEEKFFGFYSPSAGSVYPILQSLEDQGFVTSSQESGKKVYTITDEGKQEVARNKEKFAHMQEHLKGRFETMERFQGLSGELKETMRYLFGKLHDKKLGNPNTVKKLRAALANFRSEIEEIVLEEHEQK